MPREVTSNVEYSDDVLYPFEREFLCWQNMFVCAFIMAG